MRSVLSILFVLFIIPHLYSQESGMGKNKNTALLLIDIQEFYFVGGRLPLTGSDEAVSVASRLLGFFRQHDLPVIHIMHEGGGKIHPLVAPLANEKIIVKKEVNAFLHTDLYDHLKTKGIKNIVLAGMQTHMCLEAAVRAASDYGFSCTIIADACATRDLVWEKDTVKARDVQASTLATLKTYATIQSFNEYLNHVSTE